MRKSMVFMLAMVLVLSIALTACGTKTPRDYTYFLYDIVGAEEYSSDKGTAEQVGIKVIDDKTIEYTLKQPVIYFDYLVSFPTYAPVQQVFAEKVADKFNTNPEFFLTNGPFKIDSWQQESEMVFVKNPEYWDAASIKLDKVTGLMIAEESTQFNMYEAGELDHTIQLTADQKAAMTKGSVGNYSDGSVWFFDFNTTHPVLKNKNIRKALTYAIDRQSFMEDMPIGPLYFRYRDYAVREYVKGFERDSFAPDIQFIYAWIEGKSK
ncbi:MAG: peptide ABC transporter substrate-binding protein [Clostridia bacterium]